MQTYYIIQGTSFQNITYVYLVRVEIILKNDQSDLKKLD